MKRGYRKVAITWITCAAFFLGSVPLMAAPTTCQEAFSNVAAPQGVKRRTVAAAVVLVAKGIRTGNKHFGKLVQVLKGSAGTAFLKHSEKIADALDEIAKIPDVVLSVVKDKLFQLLIAKDGAFKIQPSLAKDITEEIIGVVDGLL